MATLLTLKRRIRAAQNVSKTTRAMQMIAASKLKRAQDAALSSRPYVHKLTDLTRSLSEKITEEKAHPYMLWQETTNKSLIITLAPDKGLCGGLVTNLMREFFALKDTHQSASYIMIGKKIEGQVIHLENEVLASFHFGTTLPKFDIVFPVTRLIDEYYLSKKVNDVKVLYTDFSSIFSQVPKVATLLPIRIVDKEEQKTIQEFSLFEPGIEEMLPTILKHYLEMSLYQYFLESYLSEQAARMISMQNATNNAKDIIEGLRLEYNKTRQAKITSELLDISGTKVANRG